MLWAVLSVCMALTLDVCGSVHVLPGYSCGCDTCSDPCWISNCFCSFSVEEEAYAQVGVLLCSVWPRPLIWIFSTSCLMHLQCRPLPFLFGLAAYFLARMAA